MITYGNLWGLMASYEFINLLTNLCDVAYEHDMGKSTKELMDTFEF